MLQSMYSAFNFVYWSFNTLLWLVMWLFIIVAIITFIGFINVQFFTKSNAAFSKILKEEEWRSLSNSNMKQNSSSGSSDSDQCLDDIDAISNHSSRSRRNRSRRQRKPHQELPEEMEPKWTMSKRMKTRERMKYQGIDRELSPGSASSPSESIHSISRSVSNSQTLSTSNIKSLHNKNNSNLQNGLLSYDDEVSISETSHSQQVTNHAHSHSQSISKASAAANLVSPDITEYSKFNFKLTERMRSKRKRNNKAIDSPTSQTDENENEDIQSDSYWKEQRGNRHSQEAITDISPKTEESVSESDVNNTINITPCSNDHANIEFNVESMRTFDDVYTFMDNLTQNKHTTKIGEDVRSQIQNCIDGGTLKLKSFEKALLVSKLLEL